LDMGDSSRLDRPEDDREGGDPTAGGGLSFIPMTVTSDKQSGQKAPP